MQNIYSEIKKDKQIWKFCFYGFFKNLRFFEPYLFIYLISMGMNLFQVGTLISIREIIIYVFEIPSGIFADNYGKKRELMICFTFYIISFVFFFIGSNYFILVMGMIFYGLGDAFRSGTHKAMIYSYLEERQWFKYKAFVYGRTKSFSLMGASISAFVSILFVLNLPEVKWVFLIAIIPYIVDFILISTYPDNIDKKNNSMKGNSFFKESVKKLKSILQKKDLTKILLSSSIYNGIFDSLKDYIQPILGIIILNSNFNSFSSFESDDRLKIYLGIIYGVIYICSSMASRNVHRLTKRHDSYGMMKSFLDFMGIALVMIAFAMKNRYTNIVVLLYFVLYIMKDVRGPLFVDVSGNYMDKEERATALSVNSQMKSLLLVILAPLLGYISDKFSLYVMFIFLGIFIIIANRFLNINSKNYSLEDQLKNERNSQSI
ncbi:tetracycline efflux MFS transporter TetA(P) [Clostridium sediminicola]|uniref:MFS transporter n=1 Tax=Clostridium sediminicola TaxID=3114879 RepID=UPI0031F1EBE1